MPAPISITGKISKLQVAVRNVSKDYTLTSQDVTLTIVAKGVPEAVLRRFQRDFLHENVVEVIHPQMDMLQSVDRQTGETLSNGVDLQVDGDPGEIGGAQAMGEIDTPVARVNPEIEELGGFRVND